MLISDKRITESVLDTLERLKGREDLPKDVAYDLGVAATLLRHTQHVEQTGGEGLRQYCQQAMELLQEMRGDPALQAVGRESVIHMLDTMIEEAGQVIANPHSGSRLKDHFLTFLDRLDAQLGQAVRQAPGDVRKLLTTFTERQLKQHNALGLFGSAAIAPQEVFNGEPISKENLTAFLHQQTGDTSLAVTKITTLPGGFGKQTSLFSVSGESSQADLVIRRDVAIDVLDGLDCHTAGKEFPLLKAVYERGFPVPEPLWLAEGSAIIKGPDFSIMRKSAGAVSGDATGGSDTVPAALQVTLAQVAARLHNLPPLTELTTIPAFSPELWQKSAGECARAYIEAWYEHFLDTPHIPLPALHSLFSWLLANMPEIDEPPALVHGDIGFHNLLFHDGQLSALLDWEFSHVGDPIEDIGYIRSIMGKQLDWSAFMAEYCRAGRPMPSEERVCFYEIWSHVRNAASSLMSANHFEAGRFRDVKYTVLMYQMVPHFIAKAESLIAGFRRSH